MGLQPNSNEEYGVFTVKITTKDARPLKNASQSFSVKVTTLSYSSEYTLSNSITGGGTLTTPIVGGGGESEVGGRSIIKYQTDDEGTHLTFQAGNWMERIKVLWIIQQKR